MAERARLSIVILTKNEEARIARCLESVRWADEIIVVDGLSTDRTAEICGRFGARVVPHAFEGSFATERNLGMEQATGDWVLQLDADDVATPAFRAAVERLLADPPPHAIMKFRRKSVLMGRFLRYGGWHHQLPNLIRRDVRYTGDVHERPVTDGTIGSLEADIEHHPCEDLTTFLDRHNRYATLTARELRARGPVLDEREIRRRLVTRPWKTFWKAYVKKQGFREGLHGLFFSVYFAGVELIKWAKYWELGLPARDPLFPGAQDLASARPAAGARAPRPTLAVVLMTKNEEARLPTCLDRVAGWADEIVVIDDCSADRTVEIAARYGATIQVAACEDNHDRQWNRGSALATSDWILHIDADELVTPRLREAIDAALRDPQGHTAFSMMRKNVFLGRPMRHGGWYHRHLVLFRRDRARCTGQGIHVQLAVEGTIGHLEAEIEHYPFTSLTQFIQRQNHYTTVEARGYFARQPDVPESQIRYHIGWRPVKLFWKSYVKQQGHREGTHGLVFGLLYAFMHAMYWAKYWEQRLRAAHAVGDDATPEFASRGDFREVARSGGPPTARSEAIRPREHRRGCAGDDRAHAREEVMA